ncbi:DUF378 domain-containing protein [Candidatus Woesearchaeota archaeon]|nr:MAG: DUF378 domain-containing protein [Candidatus Woesearchaeota archaeon]
MDTKILDLIALILLIIAGVNLGIAGVANYNILGAIFSSVPVVLKILNIIFGVAGLYTIYYLVKR